MSMKAGDNAPNITLRTVEGEILSLRGDPQDRNTLLIFLRHLG